MKKVVAIVITAAMTVPLLNGCTAVVDEPVASTTETTVKELGPARAEDDYFRFVNQERFNTTEIKYGDVSAAVMLREAKKISSSTHMIIIRHMILRTSRSLKIS